MRWPRPVMEESVVGAISMIVSTKCPSCIRVSVVSREITARYLDAEPVSCAKHLRCRPQIDLKAIDLPWLHQFSVTEGVSISGPQNPITNGQGTPIRPDVAEPYHPISIWCRRRAVENRLHRSNHGQIAFKWGRCVGQHSSLDWPMILWTQQRVDQQAFHGINRIVEEALCRLIFTRQIEGEHPIVERSTGLPRTFMQIHRLVGDARR